MLAKAFSIVSFVGFLALAMAWGGFWGSVAAASGDMPSWFVIVGAVGGTSGTAATQENIMALATGTTEMVQS